MVRQQFARPCPAGLLLPCSVLCPPVTRAERTLTNLLACEIEGDDIKAENPRQAIELFERVVQLESELGDQVKWRFKALQNLVVIYFSQACYEKMVERYRSMLQYIASVTRNDCTEAINTILDTVASATDIHVLSEIYEITLIALKTSNNERLWFNTNIKLAKLYLEDGKIAEMERVIKDLKKTCQTADGRDDPEKGSHLLEVYCLEIQLCALTQDSERMHSIYPRTVNLNSAVNDPRIMGIIREEGGKMQMAEQNWLDAYNEFYEAFRNYQEAGNSRARDCLKYVVLASMLSLSDINPFAAREAKAFADDPEILGMSDLRQSLEANDLARFEKTVRDKRNHIMDEPFLMKYLEPLRRRMREQVLINLVKPYQRVTLAFLAQELELSEKDVEGLVVDLIRDDKLPGLIDQTENWLALKPLNASPVIEESFDNALQYWSANLQAVQKSIMHSTQVM